MNYINPFGIISAERFQTIGRSDLKGLRKKILLEFDLSDTNEIFRGKKGYDKNEVLEIFQSLEDNLEVYQKLSILPKLQQFLEDGNLSFFSENKEVQLVKYDPKHKTEIDTLISKSLKRVIPPLISKPTFSSADTLNKINDYLMTVSPAAKEEAYNTAYLELTNNFDQVQKIRDPFVSQTNLQIKPEVKKYINKAFYSIIQALPDSFNKLRSDYGLWCNNNVLLPGIKHKRINSAPKESLIVIRNAAKIASNFHNKEGNLKIVRQLDDRIKGNHSYSRNTGSSSSDSGGFKWYHVIYIVILLIKVPLLISKCSSNNSRSSYNKSRSYTNSNQYRDYNKIAQRNAQREANRKAKSKYSVSVPRNESVQLFRYCGEDRGFLNATYKGKRMKNNKVELRFDVDVIPAKNTFFHLMIPEEVKEQFKGSIVPLIFTFTERDFRKNKFSHEVKVDFKSTKIQSEYNFKRPAEGLDDILSTKKLYNSAVNFSATISKIDPSTHKVSHKRKLDVVYSGTNENFRVNLSRPTKSFKVDKDYVTSDTKFNTTSGTDSIRIAAIIKNLKLIPSSRLKRNGIYTMANVATYDLENLDKKSFNLKTPKTVEGRLKYRLTSVADNTALCSITAPHFAAFYFIDAKTDKIRAMTMAVESVNGKDLELIEVHLN